MVSSVKKYLPSFVRPAARFIRYKNQRKKVLREIDIRRQQDKLIRQFNSNTEKLIVVIIMGADWETGIDKISGGAISIVSICEETEKLKSLHGAEVILCTLPMDHLFIKHTQFLNSTNVFRFSQLNNYFTNVKEVILHIPEFLTENFSGVIKSKKYSWLRKTGKVHINIMNQNIQLMPSPEVISDLKKYCSLVTVTTAHQQYCNRYYRDLYNTSLHKLSVWISPEKYYFKKYEEKENLIIVSPDTHPLKEKVIEKLARIEGLRIQVIQNLTYEEYKKTISKAKWAITFGEGLDGYIIEPVFSGAIGFAVYNEDFFTSDFSALKTIYSSFDIMADNIMSDIDLLDKSVEFTSYHQQQYDLLSKHYSEKEYKENIALFYKEQYTFK